MMSTTTAAAPARATAEWLPGLVIAGLALLTLTAAFTGSTSLQVPSFLLLLLFVAASWRRALPQARMFAALALPISLAAGLWADDGWSTLRPAMSDSLGFASLLAALATLRVPMRQSRLVAQAAGWLVSCGPSRRGLAMAYGGHALSLIFNVGVLPLVGEMIRHAGLDPKQDPTARQMLLSAMRGAALVTAWSPLGMGFAIVSTTIPGLDPLLFLPVAFGAALLLVGLGGLLGSGGTEVSAAPQGEGRAVVIILVMSAVLLAGTLLLYRVAGVPFITATTVVLPVFSLVWLLVERSGTPASDTPAVLLRALTELRSEIFIFCASTFIGRGVIALAGQDWLGAVVHLPGALGVLLCLALVPAVACLSVAPTIVVLLLAQGLGQSAMATAAPMAFAAALTFGWSVAIGISPVSATLLIAGNISGTAPRRIALEWNLRFTLLAFCGAAALVALLHALGR